MTKELIKELIEEYRPVLQSLKDHDSGLKIISTKKLEELLPHLVK